MDDWLEPAGDAEAASPKRMLRAQAADEQTVTELTALIEGSKSPAIVAGAGAADPDAWAALIGAGGTTGLPGLAGGVRRSPRLSAGPPALCRLPPGRPRRASLGPGRQGPCPERRSAGLPAVPVRLGAARRIRHQGGRGHGRPGGGAPQPGGARRSRYACGDLRPPRRAPVAAAGGSAGPALLTAGATHGARCRGKASRRSRPLRAGRATTRRRGSRRGNALQPA